MLTESIVVVHSHLATWRLLEGRPPGDVGEHAWTGLDHRPGCGKRAPTNIGEKEKRMFKREQPNSPHGEEGCYLFRSEAFGTFH